MFNKTIVSKEIADITTEHFYRAVNIYLFKPHVVNRKLFGINCLHKFAYRKRGLNVASFFRDVKAKIVRGFSIEDSVLNSCETHQLEVEKLPDNLDLNRSEFNNQEHIGGYLVLNRILPRNLNVFQPLDVLAVTDYDSQSTSFVCLQEEENNLTPKFPFAIQLEAQNVNIKCSTEPVPDEKSLVWLKDVLFQRLLKWIDNLLQEASKVTTKKELVSLSLINNMEDYNRMYGELKTKYGVEMVKVWPETTDPKKYVYEDVAIATYLLVLWKQEREESGSDRLQSFVDVGCGNGLLVYILASEGHKGFGIDLRKRKIWDLYPGNVNLKLESIVPSDDSLFPQTDWIIGNHSDELSPWIPVLAARSSFQCRFFLLPCCAFEFDGSKFQRQNSNVSQYTDFLRYVKEISVVCGFETAVDRLKIPSTKRTCLVGSGRVYREEEFGEYAGKIQTFIDSRTNAKREGDGNWSEGFKPRDSVEQVKNCTKIERSIIDEIVRIVFEALIAKKRISNEFTGRNWNAGGTIAIGELVQMIPQEKLNNLKSECGGLQTLLKNNHQIFQVLNGCVQLRIPTRDGESSKSSEELKKKLKKQKKPRIINLKERPCWFNSNHPDGCPFEEKDCKFKH